MRMGWLSDIHLNFLDESGVRRFIDAVASEPVDGWLLGGDIGEAASVMKYLRLFEAEVPAKTYFTLGNHDFYGGSLQGVHAQVRSLVEESERLIWLNASQPQMLGGSVALVGDDAWADARFGDPEGTPVELNDFYLIEELAGLTRKDLICRLNRLGDASAARLAPKIKAAAGLRRQVVILTHVPPFREAAWHQGRRSTDDWLPWFSCQAVGREILASARSHPENRFLVLCGHTHGAGVWTAAPNVMVRTAHAVYGSPWVQDVIEFA